MISATIRNNNRQQLKQKQKHKLRTIKINHLHPTPQNKSKSSFYPRRKPAPSSCTDLSAIPDTVVPWEFPSWLHRCEALSLDRWNNLRFNPTGSKYGIFAYTFSTIKINQMWGNIPFPWILWESTYTWFWYYTTVKKKKQTKPIRDIKTVYHSTCHQSPGPAYPRPLPANLAITWSAFGSDAAGTWQTMTLRLHDTWCT